MARVSGLYVRPSSEPPVHTRIVEPGQDESRPGHCARDPLDPPELPGSGLERAEPQRHDPGKDQDRKRRAEGEEAREAPPPGAPPRQGNREPEEEPEERRAEGE